MRFPFATRYEFTFPVIACGALLYLLSLPLTACAPKLPLYLDIRLAQVTLPDEQGQAEADLLIAPFGADKAAAAAIGELLSWKESQQIRVDSRALSEGITSKIEARLAAQGLRFRAIPDWDGTLAGMQGIGKGRRPLLGGTIRRLRIDSTKKALHTVSTLYLVVDCHVGLPGTAALVTRSVEVKQEKTHLQQNTAELEQLLDEGLSEAAVRLVEKLNSVLDASPSK